MLIRTPWKGLLFIEYVGRHENWLENNNILIRCGKYIIINFIWENQHHPLIMFTWMYSKRMWNKQRYCGTIPEHVRIQNFRRSYRKNYQARKNWTFLRGPTIWRSCKEMRGTVMRVGWQNYSTTLQSINSTSRWPSIRRRRNEITGEMSSVCSQKLSWKVSIWHALVDQTCYGLWINLHERSQNAQSMWQRLAR